MPWNPLDDYSDEHSIKVGKFKQAGTENEIN